MYRRKITYNRNKNRKDKDNKNKHSKMEEAD